MISGRSLVQLSLLLQQISQSGMNPGIIRLPAQSAFKHLPGFGEPVALQEQSSEIVIAVSVMSAQLKLALPDSSQAKKSGANENPPLVVSVDAKGIYYIEKIARTLEQVRDELRTRTAQNPQLVLAINADEAAPWGRIVKLRDAAGETGIKSLVAFTKDKQ